MGKPFLKWVGGKRQLLPQIRAVLPETFKVYHEPFVGGGALFWDLAPSQAVLSDANERLIRTYRAVRDNVECVISGLNFHALGHCEEQYYRVRDVDIDTHSDAGVAVWMIYLNKTCFNGLYRVNRDNRHNVAMGDKLSCICDQERLRACSEALQGIDLEVSTFDVAALAPKPGDLVYCDPPYVGRTSFVEYTAGGFGVSHQVLLRNVASDLIASGVHVVLSNSWGPAVRELYAGPQFDVLEVYAGRSINSKGNGRGKVSEALIVGQTGCDGEPLRSLQGQTRMF